MKLAQNWVLNLKQVEPFLPLGNPTFDNPDFADAAYRVLIVRLSPFRDVDKSIPHLFLFQEVRQALPDAFIDLAFFPTAAQRERFERDDVPFLLGTQSLRSADEFDLILISNAYTLELINLPYLLIHSRIPLFSSQRGPEWPIIILGGSNALATQAIIREDGDSLVDGIFFGEGEGLVSRLVRFLEQNRSMDKQELLERAAQAQRLQAGRAAAHQGIQQTRRPVGEGLPDEFLGLSDPGAVAVFDLVPVHDGGDEVFQFLALLVRVRGGDQGGEDSGAHGGQRSPRPPDVQRGDVPVADGFFAGGLGGDGFEGEGDFD